MDFPTIRTFYDARIRRVLRISAIAGQNSDDLGKGRAYLNVGVVENPAIAGEECSLHLIQAGHWGRSMARRGPPDHH